MLYSEYFVHTSILYTMDRVCMPGFVLWRKELRAQGQQSLGQSTCDGSRVFGSGFSFRV